MKTMAVRGTSTSFESCLGKLRSNDNDADLKLYTADGQTQRLHFHIIRIQDDTLQCGRIKRDARQREDDN